MKRTHLILIVILAALLIAAFLPVQTTHAEGIHQPEVAESPRLDTGSPVVAVAVGMTVILFGSLTVLPLLWGQEAQ